MATLKAVQMTTQSTALGSKAGRMKKTSQPTARLGYLASWVRELETCWPRKRGRGGRLRHSSLEGTEERRGIGAIEVSSL